MNEEVNKPQKSAQGDLLPPPPRVLMSKAQYARHRGCAPSAITRAIKEGRVVVVKINNRERIDQRASDAAWAAVTRQRIDAPGPEELESEPTRGDALWEVRLQKERLEVERRAMDIDRLCGLLVERDVVEYLLADLGAAFKSRLENLPDIVAPTLAASAGDMEGMRRAMQDHVSTLLNELADHFTRQVARRLPPVTEPKEVAEDG